LEELYRSTDHVLLSIKQNVSKKARLIR